MEGQVTKEGKKFDSGKPRWELVPYDALRGLAEVLTDGAKKYDARNWENGIMYGRVFGAVQRHLTAWWQGENHDLESGRSHLDHALCELVFLSAYEKRGMTNFDDRPRVSTGLGMAELRQNLNAAKYANIANVQTKE